jgi:MFS transporter, DHA1 family, inner membrane transport protein
LSGPDASAAPAAPAAPATQGQAQARLPAVQNALMAGNFAIGCGVMVTAGSLNDLSGSLQVSPALGGQLITIAAVMMGLGAPLLAALLGRWDRRQLLTLALAWYALGHALSALMPSYAALLPVRAATVLSAAVFTPQAAAAIGLLAPAAQRGRAITSVFLGWSLSSVIGMPMHAYIAGAFGWRWAFALVALISALAALMVWRAVPDGVRPAPLNLRDWARLARSPVLLGIIAVTALSAAGQFTIFSYFAPYYAQVLGLAALGISLLFFWFGAFGVLGNWLVSRLVDRIGAAKAVAIALAAMALSLALWPLAHNAWLMAAVLLPWALGCFSSNSAQQARATVAAPALAPAMMALNTSAIYLGQALGAGGGGALMASSGFTWLAPVGLAWMLLALGLSVWVGARRASDA